MNSHNEVSDDVSKKEQIHEASIPEETGHKHSFGMTLMHMVPMIILFSFYDTFEQSGNKLLFYGLVFTIVLGHGWMMIKMNKR